MAVWIDQNIESGTRSCVRVAQAGQRFFRRIDWPERTVDFHAKPLKLLEFTGWAGAARQD